jgi:hypothetical protein
MTPDDGTNIVRPFPAGAAAEKPPGAGTHWLAALITLVHGAVELGKLALMIGVVMLAGFGAAVLLLR